MHREITYKEQGTGDDSWIISEWEDESKEVLTLKDVIFDKEVQNWKIKAELSKRGLLTQVETALDALQEPMKTQAKLAWEYSPTINFKSSATKLIQAALQLDDNTTLEIFFDAQDIVI